MNHPKHLSVYRQPTQPQIFQLSQTLSNQILLNLIIKVYENGNISVHFKFADEFRKIAEYIEINTTDTAEAG